jgi:hypothetical protein
MPRKKTAPLPVRVEPQVETPAPEPVATSNTVTNCLPGTELSLGDGRKLLFGESATVEPGEAAFLRDRGQVE